MRSPAEKILIFLFIFMVLGCFNMCILEDTFAAPHSHDKTASNAEGHSHSNDTEHHHSEERSPDKESNSKACCKDVIATHTTNDVLSVSLNEAPLKLSESFLTEPIQFSGPSYEYHIDFSPGESPPRAFLTAHTNHAPPIFA